MQPEHGNHFRAGQAAPAAASPRRPVRALLFALLGAPLLGLLGQCLASQTLVVGRPFLMEQADLSLEAFTLSLIFPELLVASGLPLALLIALAQWTLIRAGRYRSARNDLAAGGLAAGINLAGALYYAFREFPFLPSGGQTLAFLVLVAVFLTLFGFGWGFLLSRGVARLYLTGSEPEENSS